MRRCAADVAGDCDTGDGGGCAAGWRGVGEDGESADVAGLLDGAWHHVAATFDGTTRRAYVDFVQVSSGTATGGGADSKADFCVGAVQGSPLSPQPQLPWRSILSSLAERLEDESNCQRKAK